MKLKVYNTQGKETGREIEVSDDIFGIEPNEHTVYLAVKAYLANQRQGTHKSKERWEVNRTTKKAFRQKGTGGARRGSYKSPIVKGGGTIFGPQPRDYTQKVNKKTKVLAKKSALSAKAKENNILVIEDFNLETPKTKDFTTALQNLGLQKSRVTYVVADNNTNALLSARNVKNVGVATASGLNIHDIVNNSKVLLSEGALTVIQENLN